MKSIKHSGMSYSERNSGDNFAEDFFEEYCSKYYIRRVGFDEKNDPIPKFYNLSAMIRNIPDYFVYANGKTFLCNVKGTDNIKQKERDIMMDLWDFYDSQDCPLLYAFCFKENTKPIFRSITDLIQLYDSKKDQRWHDGVVYRNLGLRSK